MQLTLALLAIYAAGRWMEKLRSRRWFVAYALTSAALLYTHYLPGLAIVASTSIVLLFRRDIDLSVRTRFLAAAGSSILIMILYAPWLATMHSAVSNWVSAGSYRIGSILTDQTVRLVYWFVSFGFGEAFSTLGILLGVAMTPVIVYALWRSLAERGDWFGVVLIASGIAYIGVCRWAGFPFTPARILFALPFFLILCVRGIHAGFRRSSPIFVGLLILYATGLYSYFSRTGYLNKGYCVPYQEMAAVIRNGPAVQNATLVVDTYSSIPDPLLNLIPASVGVIALDEDSAGIVREAVNRSEVVWFWRHTHDTSPGEFVSRLEHELSQGRFVAKHEFLPYSQPERWALGILRGPAQPEYFYQLLEVRK
jgi:hypothetical protein